MNGIFMLRMLSLRALQIKNDVYLGFRDYVKVFEKARHKDLSELLSKLDIFR